MTGTGKKHESGKHSEAGQKFHADAKVKAESKPDQQFVPGAKTVAPGKVRAKAANGKFTKSPEASQKSVNTGPSQNNTSFPPSN